MWTLKSRKSGDGIQLQDSGRIDPRMIGGASMVKALFDVDKRSESM